MDQELLKAELHRLMRLAEEAECIEFKQAKTNFHFDRLGKYFSALSNEANLRGRPCAWLVFGVKDRPRDIVGTEYRRRGTLQNLKQEVSRETNDHMTFRQIHELDFAEGRVILFEIPPAIRGIPTSWKGFYYGREGESLVALSLRKIEEIRRQVGLSDWSAHVCDGATIGDLDPPAIAKAREEYKKKYPAMVTEVDSWDDTVFLNKAKVTKQRKITRAAILLLGKEESEHFIGPSQAKITWILKDASDVDKDYEHFGPPFILTAEEVFTRVRNLRYRYLPQETLFPTEILKYDRWVIREALHNCIAHQDYELRGRITVLEKPDELVFSNVGSFIPGNVETVITQDSPPEIYRNPFLAAAMVNLNMIDTIGSGIIRMFRSQKERFLPLPDYDLTQPDRVVVRIQGRVLDENYTRLLMEHRDMDLATVMLLDRVQKRIRLSRDEHKFLKSRNLVEGRYPNIFVSSDVAATTGEKAKYIKLRGLDEKYYQDLIVQFITKNRGASRRDIEELILSKLPDILTEQQKATKLSNLLTKMRRDLKLIRNIGPPRKPKWVLASE